MRRLRVDIMREGITTEEVEQMFLEFCEQEG